MSPTSLPEAAACETVLCEAQDDWSVESVNLRFYGSLNINLPQSTDSLTCASHDAGYAHASALNNTRALEIEATSRPSDGNMTFVRVEPRY